VLCAVAGVKDDAQWNCRVSFSVACPSKSLLSLRMNGTRGLEYFHCQRNKSALFLYVKRVAMVKGDQIATGCDSQVAAAARTTL
jgi:hypothetical protein